LWCTKGIWKKKYNINDLHKLLTIFSVVRGDVYSSLPIMERWQIPQASSAIMMMMIITIMMITTTIIIIIIMSRYRYKNRPRELPAGRKR
jgi:heme/copper-type cytochrome/quinol oxidase subunit 2